MFSNQKSFFDEEISRPLFVQKEGIWKRIVDFLANALLLLVTAVLLGLVGSELVEGLDRGGPVVVRAPNGDCEKVLYPGDLEGPCRKVDILREQKKKRLNNKK